MKSNKPEFVNQYLNQIYQDDFDREIYDILGILVIKNAVPKQDVEDLAKTWDDIYQAKNGAVEMSKFNTVMVTEKLPDNLKFAYRNPNLVKFAKKVIGENVALLHHRMLFKAPKTRTTKHLHHDYCYEAGLPNKCSIFLPLDDISEENGGVTYFPGTQKYGYLTDAGEINPDYFPDKWTGVTPQVNKGDIILMNTLLWHSSAENHSTEKRTILQSTYQPSSEPSSSDLVSGVWETDIFLPQTNPLAIFTSSRLQKINSLYKEIESLKAELAAKN